jgi:hypothetical protein
VASDYISIKMIGTARSRPLLTREGTDFFGTVGACQYRLRERVASYYIPIKMIGPRDLALCLRERVLTLEKNG